MAKSPPPKIIPRPVPKGLMTEGYKPSGGKVTAGHQPTTSQNKPASTPSGGSGGKK